MCCKICLYLHLVNVSIGESTEHLLLFVKLFNELVGNVTFWSSIRFCKCLSTIVDRKYFFSLLNDENACSLTALVAGVRRINLTTFTTSDKNSLSDGDKVRINRISSCMFRSLQSNFFFQNLWQYV